MSPLLHKAKALAERSAAAVTSKLVEVGVPPRLAVRALLVLLAACIIPPVALCARRATNLSANVLVPCAGTVVLGFDNSGSWLRERRVLFRIRLNDGTGPGADLL